jgi:hypothetical protein
MSEFKLPIIFQNMRYYSIEKFDCKVVSLRGYLGKGGVFTEIQISPVEHREIHSTWAKLFIREDAETGYTTFAIRDDYKRIHTVQIPSYMHKEIRVAIESAKELQIYYEPGEKKKEVKLKYEYFTIKEIKTPKPRHECIINHWWALSEDGKVMTFEKYKPQCNINKNVTKMISKKLHSGMMVFIPLAYVPIDYRYDFN